VSAAADDVTSPSAAGSESRGGIAFTTTHWNVVLEAQGESPAAQEALEQLCRTYWRPVYGFIRRQGTRTEDAQDLTQGFFALLLVLVAAFGSGSRSIQPAPATMQARTVPARLIASFGERAHAPTTATSPAGTT
jgi:hypothetical protein